MRRIIPLVAVLLAARLTHAQPVTVRGVAWDSLRARPLDGAFVALGDGRSATADARGRFHFDSVTPGRYVVSVQHAALDSAGVGGVALRAIVGEGQGELRVGSPSFATLWHSVCGARAVPNDSGLVLGTVLDARTNRPLGGASVEATWAGLGVGGATDGNRKLDVVEKRYRAVTRADADGRYGMCGLPDGVALRVRATTDSAASGAIDLLPSDLRVRRVDLRAASIDSARVSRGTIVGVVTATEGAPLADARVVTDGIAEQRTDAKGRVVLRDVPIGTRQVEVFALGRTPVAAAVDVAAGDTASFSVQLRKVTTLDVVRVTASAKLRRFLRDLRERQASGFGYMRDSSQLATRASMRSVFDEFPGMHTAGTGVFDYSIVMRTPRGTDCTAKVWVDGMESDYDMLRSLHADEIAVVEAYPHVNNIPAELLGARRPSCGVVAVWTKLNLR